MEIKFLNSGFRVPGTRSLSFVVLGLNVPGACVCWCDGASIKPGSATPDLMVQVGAHLGAFGYRHFGSAEVGNGAARLSRQ